MNFLTGKPNIEHGASMKGQCHLDGLNKGVRLPIINLHWTSQIGLNTKRISDVYVKEEILHVPLQVKKHLI